MIGCPSGPTRICVGPDAGPLIRGISVDRGTGFVFCFACGEIREDLCARCAQGIAVKVRGLTGIARNHRNTDALDSVPRAVGNDLMCPCLFIPGDVRAPPCGRCLSRNCLGVPVQALVDPIVPRLQRIV